MIAPVDLLQGKCLIVDDRKVCYMPLPPDDGSKCVKVSGYLFCEKPEKEPDTTIKEEASKALKILLNPGFTLDDIQYTKARAVDYIITFTISAFAFVVSIFISHLINTVLPMITPLITILTDIIVIVAFISGAVAIAFVEYRVRKAVMTTKIMERATMKSIPEAIEDALGLDSRMSKKNGMTSLPGKLEGSDETMIFK